MTLATEQTPRDDYTATGGEPTFAYTFKVSDETHLKVYIDGVLQTITTNYTVTNVGVDGGGNIVLVSPASATAGQKWAIVRDVPLTQGTKYPERGNFPALAHEDALDKLTMISQDLKEDLGRAIKFGESDSNVPADIPALASRKGKLLGFNSSTGDAEMVTPTEDNTVTVTSTGSTTTRTLANRFAERLNVLDYGAAGDGVADDTTKIQAALDAVPAGGAVVYFPKGTYKISSVLTCTDGRATVLVGDGPNVSIINQTGATADGIRFHHTTLTTGGGVYGLTIQAGGGGTGSESTGTGLSLLRVNDNFVADWVDITNFDTSYKEDSCWNVRLQNFRFLHFTNAGYHIPASTGSRGGGAYALFGKISNNGFTGTNTSSKGIHIEDTGGANLVTIDVTSTNEGVVVKPPSTSEACLYLFFTQVLADTCTTDAWVFDGTTDFVYSVSCTNCWGAFSTNGDGLVVKGANLDSLTWSGGRLRENGAHGASLEGGVNVRICDTEIAQNSKATDDTSHGINVAAGVDEFMITNNRIGNYASGEANGQNTGINIASGDSTNFIIDGNDLRGNTTALANGTSSSSYVIQNNLPVQTAGVNRQRGTLYSGTSVGTVAANTTVYLGPNGDQASELDSYIIPGEIGLVGQVLIQVTTEPGTSESFTYTVRKNDSDTSMTGSISGTGTFQLLLTTNQVALAATDRLSLKLVTSTSAAASRHRWAIRYDS